MHNGMPKRICSVFSCIVLCYIVLDCFVCYIVLCYVVLHCVLCVVLPCNSVYLTLYMKGDWESMSN